MQAIIYLFMYVEFSGILIGLTSFQCFIFCSYKEFLHQKHLLRLQDDTENNMQALLSYISGQYIYNDYKILSYERFEQRCYRVFSEHIASLTSKCIMKRQDLIFTSSSG